MLLLGTWIAFWPISALIAALVATYKSRSFFGWLLLGLIFGPLALLAIAVASKDEAAAMKRRLATGEARACPACREAIDRAASICPNCRTAIEPLPPRTALERFAGIG